jgi:hypothetical protein
MLDRIAYWRVASILYPASEIKDKNKKVGENIVENRRSAARIKKLTTTYGDCEIAYIFGGSPLAFSATRRLEVPSYSILIFDGTW